MGFYGHGFYDINISQGLRPFLVLERLNGGSLLSLLHQAPGLFSSRVISYKKALEMGVMLLEALTYIHEQFHQECMIIHRDLKPGIVISSYIYIYA